jgi:hypothetical protein
MIILSFPGGAGGNWLKRLIRDDFEEFKTPGINFHRKRNTDSTVKLIHELDRTKFTHLYSGTFYFNFYVNVLYKHFVHERKIQNLDYESALLTCVDTAKYICSFDLIKDSIHFDFDDLVHRPDEFIRKVNAVQLEYQLPITHSDRYFSFRKDFFDTCVNISDLHENFDNMIWTSFVIGQLMNLNIVPNDFEIHRVDNQSLCKKFAIDNYSNCMLKNSYEFQSSVLLDDFLSGNVFTGSL